MAAEARAKVSVEVTGLGKELLFAENFVTTIAPTKAVYNYRVLGTVDTEEALDLGDITTVELVIIKAIDYELEIDCNYTAATFRANIQLAVGEVAMFKPSSAVYVNGAESDETPAYEFIVIGTA